MQHFKHILIITTIISIECHGNVNLSATNNADKSDAAADNYSEYVENVFKKYGHDGILDYQGLTNLMQSLGIFRVAEESEESDAGSSHELPISSELDLPIPPCLTPLSIAKYFYDLANNVHTSTTKSFTDLITIKDIHMSEDGVHYSRIFDDDLKPKNLEKNLKLTPEMFMKICPSLLMQIESGSACHRHHKTKVNMVENVWLYASVTLLIISLCGLSGIILVPLTKSPYYDDILRFLIAIAVGTLCGDALMHLLPHALVPHDHHHESTYSSHSAPHDENEKVWICGCAFLSLVFMYALESIMPIFIKRGNHGGHGHSHQLPAKVAPETKVVELNNLTVESNPMAVEQETSIMLDLEKKSNSAKLTPMAVMVIIGDGLHNITDGLAIGAAFTSDPITGVATALAVLLHELPHELGDFALLITTGMSIKRAMYYNIISSILSFTGMAIGIFVVQIRTSFAKWIYAFTAGSFLYIALVDLVPELNRTSKGSVKCVIIHAIGLCLGGLLMLMIGLHEDRIKQLFE